MSAARLEEARARMLELFPGGFEESLGSESVELTAYTDGAGEEMLYALFGAARASDVPDDWPDRWRDFHRPARVGPLWVGPPWETAPADAIGIVIDPGRAFGTGSHATTRLSLELLLDLPQGSALDVGCGSGVLAIAAARLGFGPVLAVDVDAAAVEATRANAEANGVELEIRRADARADDLPAADVALLNVSAETVAEVVPRLAATLVVASGYLAGEHPEVKGYRSQRRVEADGWAADLLGPDSSLTIE